MRCCSDVLALLMDYLDQRLPPATHQDLERHLADCPACVASVNTYRSTVSLLQSLREDDLPGELRIRLRAFLDDRARS